MRTKQGLLSNAIGGFFHSTPSPIFKCFNCCLCEWRTVGVFTLQKSEKESGIGLFPWYCVHQSSAMLCVCNATPLHNAFTLATRNRSLGERYWKISSNSSSGSCGNEVVSVVVVLCCCCSTLALLLCCCGVLFNFLFMSGASQRKWNPMNEWPLRKLAGKRSQGFELGHLVNKDKMYII